MQQPKERIYAFDTLRTIMVLLGIMLHAAAIYCATDVDQPSSFVDSHNHSQFFDLLVDLIHTFRMPVFFVISGFFTAMLAVENGYKKMITNRLHRLVYPFLAGVIIMIPMSIYYINLYQNVLQHPNAPFDITYNYLPNIFNLANISTYHLWFLYYLICFCFLFYMLSNYVGKWFPNFGLRLNSYFNYIFHLKGLPIIFALKTILFLGIMGTIRLTTVSTFAIKVPFFLTYLTFFTFGWFLYKNKHRMNTFTNSPISLILGGLLLFSVRWMLLLLYPDYETNVLFYLLLICYGISIWLFIYGFLGVFFKYFNFYSSVAKYISDGSYWIYLIHFPILLFIQIELLPYKVSPFLKFFFGMTVTVFLSVISYNYCVRNTFIGKFLNGKKYPKAF